MWRRSNAGKALTEAVCIRTAAWLDAWSAWCDGEGHRRSAYCRRPGQPLVRGVPSKVFLAVQALWDRAPRLKSSAGAVAAAAPDHVEYEGYATEGKEALGQAEGDL